MRFIVVIFLFGIFQSCSFEKDETLLAEHLATNGGKISIYFVGLGATTSDVMHVKRSDQEEPILVINHNCLRESKLLNDSTLKIIVTDTGYMNQNNKLDTTILHIDW